jgi:tetratricopeptide (TPR) repeat protein
VDSFGTHAEPDYYKGIYYANLGDKQKAISEFNLALNRDYYFLDAYIEKAAAQYELKKYNDALKTLQLLLTISPKHADGYYWLGKCLEALGDREQANLNYQKALGLDKDMKEAREGLERTR